MRLGAVTITDNALGGAQTISLSGTGEDFTPGATTASMTVNAGATASYTVSVTPEGGFNQAVALNCSGAPLLATCSLSPNSVTPNGSAASSVTVTATTP